MQLTIHTNDFVNAKRHAREKPLLVGQGIERKDVFTIVCRVEGIA